MEFSLRKPLREVTVVFAEYSFFERWYEDTNEKTTHKRGTAGWRLSKVLSEEGKMRTNQFDISLAPQPLSLARARGGESVGEGLAEHIKRNLWSVIFTVKSFEEKRFVVKNNGKLVDSVLVSRFSDSGNVILHFYCYF